MTERNDALECYKKYRNEFVNYIIFQYRIDLDDALDIYQESILALLEKQNKDSGFTMLSPRAYLFNTVRNNTLKFIRHKNLQTEMNDYLEGTAENIDTNELEESINRMQRCLEKIGKRCQEILQLWSESIQAKEIAQLIGTQSTQGVRNQISSCKNRLKQHYYLTK